MARSIPRSSNCSGRSADWMAINGEAIYGTRPWHIYGEGPVQATGGHFKEDFAYTAKDIRFTTKGNRTLYAIALGWPSDGQLTIRCLAKPTGESINNITDVTLLGRQGKIDWKQTADGLMVKFPAEKPCDAAYVLKITGNNLKPVTK